MSRKTVSWNPYLVFLPFLVAYSFAILWHGHPAFCGDEELYVAYSQNIIDLLSAKSGTDFYLGIGPGYPLFILPFVLLGAPMVVITLMNGLVYYLSIVLLFKTLQMIVKQQFAWVAALFWAFYYNSYENFVLVVPETLAPVLMVAVFYFFMKAIRNDSKLITIHSIATSLLFAFLALTKIIFGYVIIVMLMAGIVLWLLNRGSILYRKSLLILMFALLATFPYLAFTYQLTGKVFYWGVTAGNNMYWMSTPYTDEYGSWLPDPVANDDSVNNRLLTLKEFRKAEQAKLQMHEFTIPGTNDYAWNRHGTIFTSLKGLSRENIDASLKEAAYQNIKANPLKYLQNCMSNVGRILFNFPYSYTLQRPATLLRIPPNAIIVLLVLFSLVPALINWKRVPYALRFFLFFVAVYFGGSITGSAETRMFTVIVPFLLCWIAYFIQRTIKVNLKMTEMDGNSLINK